MHGSIGSSALKIHVRTDGDEGSHEQDRGSHGKCRLALHFIDGWGCADGQDAVSIDIHHALGGGGGNVETVLGTVDLVGS